MYFAKAKIQNANIKKKQKEKKYSALHFLAQKVKISL